MRNQQNFETDTCERSLLTITQEQQQQKHEEKIMALIESVWNM